MPSPWLTGQALQGDLEGFKPEAGWILELKVQDENGDPQGEALVGVLVESTGSRHGGWQVIAMYLSASDEYYRWWMDHGEGKKIQTKGVYHLCGDTVENCKAQTLRHIHAHIGRSRRVLEDELNSRRVTWLKNEARAILEANLVKFHAALRKGPVLPAKGDGDPGAVQVGEVRRKEKKAAAESDSREHGSSDSSSTSVDMKRKLKKLREDLAEAEKEKAEKKGKKHQPARRARRKENKDVEKGKERKKSERKARGRSKDRKRRKSRKRSKSPASEAEKSKKEKKRRKRRQKSKSSSSTRSKGEATPLFQPATGASGKQALDGGDRGPFGGGNAVDFNGSSSSEESSFRKGSSVSAKSSQMRLVRYAERHPGRLASRLLLKMQEAAARGAPGPNSERRSLTPAVAQNHLLTVLLPSLAEKAGVRTRRELKTLTKILDSLAKGDPAGAADVVAQRVKALERASHEGHWGTAQYLELLPPENTTLLDRSEESYVTAQFLMDQRIRSYDQPDRRKGLKGGKEKEGKGKDGKDKKGKGPQDRKEPEKRT